MVLPLRAAIHKQSEENELSSPRAPEVKMGSQGLALLRLLGASPWSTGAQRPFPRGRTLAVDRSGCSSGRGSWSSKARRAGLTPALPAAV